MFFVQPVAANENWELVEEKNGVQLYKKDVVGSRYNAFMAVTEIDAVMAAIGAALRDVPAYPEWMETIKEAHLLEQYDANNMDVYLVMEIPFPFKDRDAVVKAETTIDPQNGAVTASSRIITNASVPEQKGLVRLPYIAQTFRLAYKSYETTEVTFTLHVETGGYLPADAVNMVTQSVPYKSLQNLRQIVRKEKYQAANPFTPINIGITKTITKSILKQYITDDEFLIMLAVTDMEGSYQVTERIRQMIEASSFSFNGIPLKVTMTFGLSTFRGKEDDIESCIKRADEALYAGKSRGRNQVIVEGGGTI